MLGFEAKTPVFQGASENEIGLLMKVAALRWMAETHRLDLAHLPDSAEELGTLTHMARRLPVLMNDGGDGNGRGSRGIGQPFDAYAGDELTEAERTVLLDIQAFLLLCRRRDRRSRLKGCW